MKTEFARTLRDEIAREVDVLLLNKVETELFYRLNKFFLEKTINDPDFTTMEELEDEHDDTV